MVIGTADVITNPAQIHHIEQLHLAPWAPLRNRVFIRLTAAEITGRRLPLHPGAITVVRQSPRIGPGTGNRGLMPPPPRPLATALQRPGTAL